MDRRTLIVGAAALGFSAATVATRARPAAARTAGFFDDVGQISAGNHMLPAIIANTGTSLTIAAQVRYTTTVPGGHHEKGAADIVTFHSTDNGQTWGPMRYVYQTAGPSGQCGYAPVLYRNDGDLVIMYAVGPQNWSTDQLTVHQRRSTDDGDTWGPVTTPTITSAHTNGLPSNGGKGFTFLPGTGRIVVPGRACLLYSDDGGASWTATPEFAGTVETKAQPYFIDGAISRTALVPWRTGNTTDGRIGKIRIADFYSNNGTVQHSFGASNNLGFDRYDNQTLIMTVTRSGQLYVRRSVDEGQTWIDEKLITGSAPSVRYSDVAVAKDGTIVVVYMTNETSASNGAPLHVVRFDMDWLTS
ncbi:exo-alpha-sialidase [Phytohabitans kaempferiae]|uniref:exo-alpha-sialidase n=1 Tax=Phytohabitans kaempferiae TaxID=1620943 RepID=A0ABV6LUL3_9ACTN